MEPSIIDIDKAVLRACCLLLFMNIWQRRVVEIYQGQAFLLYASRNFTHMGSYEPELKRLGLA